MEDSKENIHVDIGAERVKRPWRNTGKQRTTFKMDSRLALKQTILILFSSQ